MDKKIKGSWLIHHTNKLQNVTSQNGYDKTFLAGKAGILLSAISADDQITVSNKRLKTLATAANISVIELPVLKGLLQKRNLIDVSKNGIDVLGVTSSSTLQHTADLFEALTPQATEQAAIEIAEKASQRPVSQIDLSEEISDIYKMPRSDVRQLLSDSEQIGFVDVEQIGKNEKLFFNGNLFRREEAKKVKLVLDSLSRTDQNNLIEINDLLKKRACITIDEAKKLLGNPLFRKVAAIGLYDISIVSNSSEEVGYLTLPSAFSKFSTSMVDDAFDFAKALVSSITYGMTKSDYARGQIRMVEALLNALIRGERVGPVRAIAEDYKILELKGVVKVQQGTKNGRTGPMLKLLKREVGELARQAIRHGDVSEHSLITLPTAAVTKFKGPELNRERVRKKQIELSPKATNDMLDVLRTGGGF